MSCVRLLTLFRTDSKTKLARARARTAATRETRFRIAFGFISVEEMR